MPKKIPIIEQRHFIRHPLCIPLEYRILEKTSDKDSQPQRSMTINISQGGLMFSARRAVPQNRIISVKMPFQDKVFNVRAKVVHCNKNSDTKLYNIGVSFYRFTDAFKAKLIEQLYLISEYRDLRSIQLGRDVSLEQASEEWIKRYSARFKRLYW
ncbi:MAG: PilZ domain-containing protein [Candidatus Omnitrophica bacterium]|nr:PilZ domain-containing protein [Candidatus Omnitrophota bacterium]